MWLKILFLAVLQGVTEFLPISSSGHLAIAQSFLGIGGDGDQVDSTRLIITLVLHAGSLLSIIAYYWKDLWAIVFERNYRLVALLVVGTIPTVIVGFTLKHQIDKLESNFYLVCCFLIVTALILRFLHRPEVPAVVDSSGGGDISRITWTQAALIGCLQALAINPGISRSGSTISMATRLGVGRIAAARFSFYLGSIAIGGAMVLFAKDLVKALHHSGGASGPALTVSPGILLMGLVVSAVVGYVSLSTLIKVLQRGKFVWFSYYCFTVAILAMAAEYLRSTH